MQYAHIISDFVLAFCGFYVFIKFLTKLNLSNTILWESFVMSVSFAALFGAIRFAGYEQAGTVSLFFQQLAAITGGIGLVGAVFGLVMDVKFSRLACFVILAIAFLLFAVAVGFKISFLVKWLPLFSMTLVAILGILGLFNKKVIAGVWILAAVVFFALGTFRNQLFGEADSTIDIFHYLTAAGILSLGMAAGQTTKEI
jgi:hypothetical protein